MRARARHVRTAPDLTSLLDVLFIVVFLALIRAAAAQQVATQPVEPLAPPPVIAPPPGPPPALARLRAQALSNIATEVEQRTPLVIRISAAGVVEGIELDGKTLALDVPLLEHSPDPDAALTYLGDRSAELRLCRVAVVQLRLTDLSNHLVIIAPAVPLADLKRALHRGLHEDVQRCLAEQRGVASIVDPASLPMSNAPSPPPQTP